MVWWVTFWFRHVPKAKATTMAETPELKRIAENTKLQSNVKYHADFERSKGKFTQVADDPETLRIKQNTKIIRWVFILYKEFMKNGKLLKNCLLQMTSDNFEFFSLIEFSIIYFSSLLSWIFLKFFNFSWHIL